MQIFLTENKTRCNFKKNRIKACCISAFCKINEPAEIAQTQVILKFDESDPENVTLARLRFLTEISKSNSLWLFQQIQNLFGLLESEHNLVVTR